MADRSRRLADRDRMFGRHDAPKPDLLFFQRLVEWI
jgi:hypothetical protein